MDKIKDYRILFLCSLAGLSFAIFFLISSFGNMQFAGMDSGVLVNAAYQGLLGYVPYSEIITATPPIYLIGAKVAFQLFGVRWLSLVYISALFSTLTFLLHVLILRRYGINRLLSILLALYIQSITQIILSFWNYNRVSIVLMTLFISSVLLFYKNPKSFLNRLILIILTSVIFLIKINFVLIMMIPFLILFIKPKGYTRKQLFLFFFLSAFFTYLILWLNNISTLDVIKNYILASPRALNLRNWYYFIFSNVYWERKETLVLALPALLGFTIVLINYFSFKLYKKDDMILNSFIFVTLVAGVIALGTNNDYRMTSASLIIFGLFFFVNKWGNKNTMSLFSLTLLLFIFSGIYKGYTRYNLQESSLKYAYNGFAVYYDGNTNLRPLSHIRRYPFFNNLLASQRMINTLNNSDSIFKIIKKYDRNINQSIFIGPRIDFLYAMYNIKPPKGLPLWWEAYTNESYESKKMIKKFESYKFKVAMFYFHDYTFFPESLINYIKSNYDTYDYDYLTIHVIKGEKSLDSMKGEINDLTKP